MGRPAVTHYDVLGVAPGADPSELREAYVRAARRHHPDVPGGDAARMRDVNAAWATLGDPIRRARYDESLVGWPADDAARAQRDGDRARSEADDLLADLADDTPIGGTVVLPRWLSLVPVATFAFSVAAFVIGVLMTAPALLSFALMAFLLSCVLFIAAPFLALLTSRRQHR